MSLFEVATPQWNEIDAIKIIGDAMVNDEQAVVIPTDAGSVQIRCYPNWIRVSAGAQRDNRYGMLQPQSDRLDPTLSHSKSQWIIEAEAWRIELNTEPLSLAIYHQGKLVRRTTQDGHFVRRHRIPPMARLNKGWFMAWELQSGEPVYGLGEKWGKLDKRGQLIHSYNHDALGVNAEISYKNTPFAWSPKGWGSVVHTPSPVVHAVGYAPWSQRSYGITVEDDALDLWLCAGDTGADILKHYQQLTGTAPTPPPWSLGVILSKAYYRDVAELLSTAKTVREHHMPCDTITIDGRAWQDTDTRFAFEWDPSRWPDPKPVLDELKAMHFKICVWEYPLISVNNALFDELAEKGWLLKDRRTGEAYRYQWDMQAFGNVLSPLPESGILDFTHPDAYTFWRDSHRELFEMGVDMIKVDFGEQVEDDNMLAANGECGRALHNVYSLLYNRCVYEAAEKYSTNGPFLFTRSAWMSQQQYPSQWGGDPQADWEGFIGNVRGGLSWGLSGAPFYATDIGGFYKDTRDPDLFVRWAQAGVFSAHMRLHGIGQREPWSYGPEAERAAMAALKLRYRLLPYIEATLHQSTATGLPCQRPMVLAFPDHPETWAFEEQFMFGDDILVAPCFNADHQVQLYLPHGQWVRWDDNSQWSGNQTVTLSLALDEMAVFVRQGTRLPLGPEVEHIEALGGNIQVSEYRQF